MSKTEIFFPMRQKREYVDDSPSKEETDDDVSWIMYTSNNASETGDKTKYEKEESHTWSCQEYMKCPPRSPPKHRMARRK
jgi:hypothetical protein